MSFGGQTPTIIVLKEGMYACYSYVFAEYG
jgi:hypothetical protein